MDLKIKDVAELLNVSETTIRRWLTAGKIPAYKIQRQYRFSRIEIEEWVMKHKLNKTYGKSPFAIEEDDLPRASEGKLQYSLMRALYRGAVYHDIPGETKEEVIRNAMALFAHDCDLDAEVLTELLLDRENLMPTALNNGLAVPHARDLLSHQKYNTIAIAFPKKPIDYGALDGKPVFCLFFLFAAEDRDHLHLLAKIAHLSSHAEALELLRSKPDKATLLSYVKTWESRVSRQPENETVEV